MKHDTAGRPPCFVIDLQQVPLPRLMMEFFYSSQTLAMQLSAGGMRAAHMPVFTLRRGGFEDLLPHKGDTLHRRG